MELMSQTGGGTGWSIQMVMGDILVQTRALSEGMAQMMPDAPLTLNARDKQTGEVLGSVSLPHLLNTE